MAVVRLTEELKTAIKRNGEALFHTADKDVEALRPTDMGNFVYETLFAEYKEVLERLPAGWLAKLDELSVSQIGYTRVHITMKVTLPWAAKPQLSSVVLSGGEILSPWSMTVQLDSSDVWNDLLERWNEFEAERNDLLARKKEFADTLNKLLEAHTTLNPALKAWPMLWSLVPDETKERHKKIVERPKKDAEALPEINTDQLSAVVALNRMIK